MGGPLEGIKAVEWGALANGPLIGVVLGDFGADVIKVEQRGVGEPLRGMQRMNGARQTLPSGINAAVENTNRSKRSISLDLKKEKGREVMYRLVEKADVFYTNYGQTTAARVGMDYETLAKINPRLVYANATGVGTKGPYADKRSLDGVGQARSALMTSLGERDTPPSQIVGAPIDATSATIGALGIAAALVARERTGIGQMTTTSLLHSALWIQIFNVQTGLLRSGTRENPGMRRHLRTKPGNPISNQYKCGDGKWLILQETQFDRFWGEFCQVMGIEEPEYVNLNIKALHEGYDVESLVAYLDKLFATKPRDEWIKIYEEREVNFIYAPVNEVSDLDKDVQIIANDYFVDFNHPVAGPIKYVSVPVQFSNTPAEVRSAAPEYGQHTEEVLLEIGYTWEDINKLREEEII